MESNYCKRLKAELFGTFTLVFIGCGTAVIAGDKVGYLGTALAFGLTLAALVYAIGPVSGCHVNPAVSLAMLVARKIKLEDCIGYILVQCLGGLIGACLVGAIVGFDAGTFGQNGYGTLSPDGYALSAGFISEFVLAFLFIFTVFYAAQKTANAGFMGFAIGFTFLVVYLVGMPITGASINPARSFGPAILAGGEAFQQVWLFWLAPVAGAVLAAFVFRYMGCDAKK